MATYTFEIEATDADGPDDSQTGASAIWMAVGGASGTEDFDGTAQEYAGTVLENWVHDVDGKGELRKDGDWSYRVLAWDGPELGSRDDAAAIAVHWGGGRAAVSKTYDEMSEDEVRAEMGTPRAMARELAGSLWKACLNAEDALTLAGSTDDEDGAYVTGTDGGVVTRWYAGTGYTTGVIVTLGPPPHEGMRDEEVRSWHHEDGEYVHGHQLIVAATVRATAVPLREREVLAGLRTPEDAGERCAYCKKPVIKGAFCWLDDDGLPRRADPLYGNGDRVVIHSHWLHADGSTGHGEKGDLIEQDTDRCPQCRQFGVVDRRDTGYGTDSTCQACGRNQYFDRGD